jgi:hypothetical protein
MVAITRAESTMALNQQQNKKQRCQNYLFSIVFPSLWLQPQVQRAKNGPKPASRAKATKMSKLLVSITFLSLWLQPQEQRTPTMALNQP